VHHTFTSPKNIFKTMQYTDTFRLNYNDLNEGQVNAAKDIKWAVKGTYSQPREDNNETVSS
jgi:hypothetical protein